MFLNKAKEIAKEMKDFRWISVDKDGSIFATKTNPNDTLQVYIGEYTGTRPYKNTLRKVD
jgi:hypothetical protein